MKNLVIKQLTWKNKNYEKNWASHHAARAYIDLPKNKTMCARINVNWYWSYYW